MPVYLVPAYIKPYSKILSWALPMLYLEEEEAEYISDYPVVKPFLKNEIPGFKEYMKLVMSKDLRGIAEKFKVSVEPTTMFQTPIEEFVRRATKEKEYGKAEVDVNLLSSNAYKTIDTIYNLLDEDLRPTIAHPTQWLVYSRKENLLTRLCWVIEMKGEVIIRPYGARGLLVEVEQIGMDRVNTPSIRALKKNILLKQRLNDYWKRLLATQMSQEEARELIEFAKGERGEEIGKIE